MEDNLGLEATQDSDRVVRVNIEEQMKTSYIDYSMSVIVGRALPDGNRLGYVYRTHRSLVEVQPYCWLCRNL